MCVHVGVLNMNMDISFISKRVKVTPLQKSARDGEGDKICEERGWRSVRSEGLEELVWLLEVLDDVFVLIRLYYGQLQKIYSQVTPAADMFSETVQQEK